jgi:hypothetical protein
MIMDKENSFHKAYNAAVEFHPPMACFITLMGKNFDDPRRDGTASRLREMNDNTIARTREGGFISGLSSTGRVLVPCLPPELLG